MLNRFLGNLCQILRQVVKVVRRAVKKIPVPCSVAHPACHPCATPRACTAGFRHPFEAVAVVARLPTLPTPSILGRMPSQAWTGRVAARFTSVVQHSSACRGVESGYWGVE